MLTTKIQKISAESQAVKRDIQSAIAAQMPPDETRPWHKIIQLGQLERGIMCAAYYNTAAQLRTLSEYATQDERSLESILKVFESIVKVGRTTALPKTMFNDTARNIVQSIL